MLAARRPIGVRFMIENYIRFARPSGSGGLTAEPPNRQIHMQRRRFLQSILSSPMIAAGWKQGLPSSFEAEILQWMGVAPVPGAIVGVVPGARPAWFRPLGVRNFETRDPVTRDTIFQA